MSFGPGTHVIVRARFAGVFAGTLKSRNGQEVVLENARRIWYWAGAASISELAVLGTSKPEKCKFPSPVPEVLIFETIEVIPTTEAARKSIEEVPVWTAH